MAHVLGIQHKHTNELWHFALSPSKVAGSGIVALLALTHVVSDAAAGMFPVLLPTLQARFDLDGQTLALLVALTSISSAFSQPLFGALADRFGQQRVAAWGVIVNAIFFSLVAVVSTVPLLIAVIVAGGLGAAALHPAGSSWARSAGGGRPQLAVSLFSAGGLVGVSLGPVLVLTLIASFGSAMSWMLMLPGVLLGLWLLRAAPSADAGQAEALNTRTFDRQLLTGPLGWLVAVTVFVNLASITFGSAVPLWLVSQHGYARDATLLGWTLTLFSLSAAVGGMLAAWSRDYVNPRRLTVGVLLLSAIPFLILFTLQPGTVRYYLAVMLAGGLSHAALPLLLVAAQDQAQSAVAMVTGLLLGFAGGVAGILYIGIGWLQEAIGLAPAMQIGFLSVLPAALLAAWLLSQRPQTPEYERAHVRR